MFTKVEIKYSRLVFIFGGKVMVEVKVGGGGSHREGAVLNMQSILHLLVFVCFLGDLP